jgi:hypothetical protein
MGFAKYVRDVDHSCNDWDILFVADFRDLPTTSRNRVSDNYVWFDLLYELKKNYWLDDCGK